MASKINVDKIARGSGTPEFTIPTADGAADTFLKTDGSGVLSFGAVTTTALTGSTNTWIPTITAANALTGTANFTYDGNTLDVKNSGTASSIKLYCETSNQHYQEIKAAPHSGSSNWTLTLPPNDGNADEFLQTNGSGVTSWAEAGGGKIGQVLQTVHTGTETLSSTTATTIPNFTVTITPAATSSKILVMVDMNTGGLGSYNTNLQIFRDTTQIYVADAAGVRSRTWSWQQIDNARMNWDANAIYLDSPSTTSAVAYSIKWYSEGSSAIYLNRTSNDFNNAYYDGRGASSITVMEVLA